MNDSDEIVQAGKQLKISKAKASRPSYNPKSKRDWGNGMATAGCTKKCTKVAPNHFGNIPGIDVGMTWLYRIQVGRVRVFYFTSIVLIQRA